MVDNNKNKNTELKLYRSVFIEGREIRMYTSKPKSDDSGIIKDGTKLNSFGGEKNVRSDDK